MKLLGKYRNGWQDYTEVDLKEIGCEDVNWIQLAQDRFHNSTEVGRFLTSWATVCFSRRTVFRGASNDRERNRRLERTESEGLRD